MKLHALKINEALNKAFLKLPLTRSQIEKFKANFKTLLQNYDPGEGEEHHKNVISEFLKKTYYSPDFYINTKGRYDLVIHNGKDNKSSVGVIIECKSPGNLAEMPVIDNLKSKALYELILYYLRERITNQNLEIKHLIITNLFDWYIFDAHEFEKHFANNKSLVKQFRDFEEGRLSGKDTSFFYSSIAYPFVNGITEEFRFTYFSLQSFDSIIKNDLLSDDHKLIPPFKVLSPEHLLKLKFKNDSNSLDKDFYLELLHIIGLEDIKKGSKSLIGRAIPERRNYGSLLESTITTLQSEDLLSQIDNLSSFGTSKDDQLFNIGLELVITWINRILFIKLLEGQLIRYNKGDRSFAFLDNRNIPDFDVLNKLFFYILAVPIQERDSRLKDIFRNVPYLNSSLFEATILERKTIRISNLDDSNRIPIFKSSILKDYIGKRRGGELTTLHYLFEFLDAYDFSSEGSKKIQEENKTLINASVLGLIFEKINGYKDGSFFTPGYITQYICHQTITNAIIQKFNTIKGWACKTIDDLHNKIEDKQEANLVINSIKICDPAVGSGHFLVSALNEIIALKSELRILKDLNGKVLRDYRFEVVNDELIISDPEGESFEYNPRNFESQRVQEAIFHEKQTIIEGSLFGVDINPNSVKICRLRLWIELLKHAYYKQGSLMQELETLPNIDINIKCGNSLISRYPLDSNIEEALKSSKWSIDNYREAVMIYRNSDNKAQKRAMEALISEIKNSFESEFSKNDKRFIRLNKINGELLYLTQQKGLFELEIKQKDAWNKKLQKLIKEQESLEKELAEIRSNQVFKNSFEWRFEFPEVLDDNGNYAGFDIILGNPPYGIKPNPSEKTYYHNEYVTNDDIYSIFIERGISLLQGECHLGYITPIFWLTGDNYFHTRNLISAKSSLREAIILPYNIFLDAYVDTGIFIFTKTKDLEIANVFEFNPKDKINYDILSSIAFSRLSASDWQNSQSLKIVLNPLSRSILNRIAKFDYSLVNISESARGILANKSDYSDDEINTSFKPILIGRIDRYFLEQKFQYILYGENLIERPKDFSIFMGERILVRRIISRQFRVMATITSEPFVVKKDIYIIKLNAPYIRPKALLAIINSRLFSFLKTAESTTAKKDDFTQLTLSDLRNLRLPLIPDETQIYLETLVSKLLSIKANNSETAQSEIDREIDQAIYKIYGLTEQEINFIELSAKMDEESIIHG